MAPRHLRRALSVLAVLLAGACATDPFAVQETRPEPRDRVRQHAVRGTAAVLDAPYDAAYRAAARALDLSAYYSVTRARGAIYGDDFHGTSSVGIFLRPADAPGRTQVEVLYLFDGEASLAPARRRQAEESYLADVRDELSVLRGGTPPESRPARERQRAVGAASDADSAEGLPVRDRPLDQAIIVGAGRHAWLGDADYAERDAEAFRRYAISVLGVAPGAVTLLTGRRATRDAVTAALEGLAGADPAARVWFYFAGLGGRDEAGGIPYLVLWDTEPRYWAKTSLPLAEVLRLLEASPAARSVAVLDASFGGEGGRTWNESAYAPHQPERRPDPGLAARAAFLYASAPGESAAVLDEQGHGLFTYRLLKALREESAPGRHPTLEDAARDAYRGVRADARARGFDQRPALAGDGDGRLW
jgi:hypothetical protein